MMVENPPAFPLHPGLAAELPSNPHVGMTLRDWFAGQAVSAFISGHFAAGGQLEKEDPPVFANTAYAIADAMLAARQEPQP